MIKIKNITKKSGFTKEQQKHIADVILHEINGNKNIGEITNFVKTQYKNDLQKAINSKYKQVINMLPKGCEIYFENIENIKYKQHSKLVAKKDGEIVAVIMPVLFSEGLKDFDTIPEIIEEKPNVVKYPVIIYQEQKEQKEQKQHANAVTGHVYGGNNIAILDGAGFNSTEWVGSGQAKHLNKQVKNDARGVVIRVYYEDDNGRSFCKLEEVYNVEELEPIKKVENTIDFQNMVERLKMA